MIHFVGLQTHEVDLKSALGMKLKRDMLNQLAERSFYPDDPQKREEIYEKYKQFDVLPVSLLFSSLPSYYLPQRTYL